MRVVASLTTSPSRIHMLGPTLTSLDHQTRPPDAIILNLPDVFQRTGEAYSVPAWIQRNHPRVVINRSGADHGPATKLIPTLLLETDAYILVVDDDQRYSPLLLERFLNAASPTRAVCQTGMSSYLVTPERPGEVDIFEAYGGVLLHTSMFGPDFFPYMERIHAHTVARMCDDLTISAYLRWKGISILWYKDADVDIRKHWDGGGVLKHGNGPDALWRMGDTRGRYRKVKDFVTANLPTAAATQPGSRGTG